MKLLVAQSCQTLCNPMNCSLPTSSVPGVSQARILEWVAMPSSRGSFAPRDQTQVSCIAGRFFTVWATRKAPIPLHTPLQTRGWKKEKKKKNWLCSPQSMVSLACFKSLETGQAELPRLDCCRAQVLEGCGRQGAPWCSWSASCPLHEPSISR